MSVRVALVGPAASPHMAKWVTALAKRDREVVVFNTKIPPVDAVGPARVVHVGPEPLPGSLPARLLAYRATAKKLRAELPGFDLTCVQWIDSNPSVLGLMDAPGLVAVPWGSDMFVREGAVRRYFKRRVLTGARVVVTGSEFLARQTERVAGRSLPLFTMFHGVALDTFSPAARKPRAEPGVRFGIAKHLVPTYGHDQLVAAFAQVAGEEPTCRLVILGDGPVRPALEQQVADLGLLDRVEFPGRVAPEQMPAFYGSIDVSISPTTLVTEGLGGTLPESIASGVPVIATAVGGSGEAAIEGVTGWLVPPGDPEALARVMLGVTRMDPADLDALRASTRRWAEDNLDMVRDLERLEDRVLGGPR